MYQEETTVPPERVAVLIGKKGETKKDLEKILKVNIEVDSKTGIVNLSGKSSINVFNAKPVIKAIAHGFSPRISKLLLREGFCLEVIDIEKFSGDSKKKMERLKSRVIGTKGKSREMVERMTNCNVSIYDKSIGIVGPVQNVGVARLALEKLLSGAPHGHAYKFIQDVKTKRQDK